MWLRVILGIIRTADSFDVCEFFFVSLQLFLFFSFSFSFFLFHAFYYCDPLSAINIRGVAF